MKEEENCIKDNHIDNNNKINIEKKEEDIMINIDESDNKLQEIYEYNENNIQIIEKNEHQHLSDIEEIDNKIQEINERNGNNIKKGKK